MSKKALMLSASQPLGYYPGTVEVPQKLTENQAKDFFDRGNRIFIVRNCEPIAPDDQHDLSHLTFSYQCDTWFVRLIPASERSFWLKQRLYVVWARILQHAALMPFLSEKVRNSDEVAKHLDFYRFVPPEVQAVPVAPPIASRPFELRLAARGKYYYMNLYKKPAASVTKQRKHRAATAKAKPGR